LLTIHGIVVEQSFTPLDEEVSCEPLIQVKPSPQNCADQKGKVKVRTQEFLTSGHAETCFGKATLESTPG